MTPLQLDASAKAPCTSTIVGLTPLSGDSWSVAVTGGTSCAVDLLICDGWRWSMSMTAGCGRSRFFMRQVYGRDAHIWRTCSCRRPGPGKGERVMLAVDGHWLAPAMTGL